MSGEPTPTPWPRSSLDETVALALSLHDAIATCAPGRRRAARRRSVAAVFEQPAGRASRATAPAGRPARSSRSRPMPPSACASSRATSPARTTRRSSRWRSACFYVVDARRTMPSGCSGWPRAADARVLSEDEARLDPTLPVGAALIRIWSELSGEPGVCVELGLRG